MRKLISLIFFATTAFSAYSQDTPTMSCLFTEFIGVSHTNPEDSQKTAVHQSMKIVLGKTDDETLNLDGSLRATNSTQWKNITLNGWETWASTFIGDFGELLTIEHDLGANKKPLHGLYKATLISTSRNMTYILLGTCYVE